jgi:hypothetical protein
MTKTAFISGHLSLSEEEFTTHYIPEIDKAIKAGHFFVVGDAPGADCMAQRYLWKHCEHHRIMVYHAFAGARHTHGFKTVGRFPSQTAKDAAMTQASYYDIAWIRKGKEISGTARNIQRRQQMKAGLES